MWSEHAARAKNAAGTIWHTRPSTRATQVQKSWLRDPGSLTRRLEHEGPCGIVQAQAVNPVGQPLSARFYNDSPDSPLHHVAVQVMREGVQTSLEQESMCLGISTREPVWVREVMLRVNGKPAVVARSVTTVRASQSVWRALHYLHNTPLAALLYSDRGVARSSFMYATVGPCHPLARLVQRTVQSAQAMQDKERSSPSTFRVPPAFLTRRSLFKRESRQKFSSLAGSALLVTECLLEKAFSLPLA